MVEYDWHGCSGDEVLEGGDDRQVRIHLYVPLTALHAFHGRLEPLARHGGVGDTSGRQIETNAAHTRLPHGIEGAFRRLVVDDGDAARVGTARLHAIERGGVIGAVDAGGDDHHTLDVENLVERRHLLG
jgi:hypothetical protein